MRVDFSISGNDMETSFCFDSDIQKWDRHGVAKTIHWRGFVISYDVSWKKSAPSVSWSDVVKANRSFYTPME